MTDRDANEWAKSIGFDGASLVESYHGHRIYILGFPEWTEGTFTGPPQYLIEDELGFTWADSVLLSEWKLDIAKESQDDPSTAE